MRKRNARKKKGIIDNAEENDDNGFPMRKSWFSEHRLCNDRLSSGPGYLSDWSDTYFKGPAQSGSVYQMVTGTAAGIASLGFEGPDRLVRGGILGEQYEAPNSFLGRTTRDVRLTLSHLFTGHPLRSLGAAFSVVTTDLPMDFLDTVSGVRSGKK